MNISTDLTGQTA